MALASAPGRVKAILEARQRGLPKRNWLFLHGKPGAGKSTLAEAIGCHLGRCFFVSAGSLMKKYRNETSERLEALFNAFEQVPGKKTLVIDELNKLTDNYSSEHTDAGTTSMVLWTNMDRFQSDQNFFFIGTANETKKLPPQLQSRFKHMFVELTGNNGDKRQMIKDCLGAFDIPKSPSIDEQFIEQLAERMKDFYYRDIENLIESAVIFALEEPSKTLTPASIEKAFQEEEYEMEHVCDLSTPISDDDRRHQESLRLQREFHDQQVVNNAAIESGLAWNSEKGCFVAYSKEGSGDHHSRSMYDDHRDEVFKYLTPEQKELMEKELDVQTKEKKRQEEEAKKDSFWTCFINAGKHLAGNALKRAPKEEK